jgi:ribose/xylose/arabinose/galactoside ABC-type transport system permease subunit
MRILLPALALCLMLAAIAIAQPYAMTYNGMRLVLNFSIPLVFASLAQLCIITLGDIDLGVGPFIALVTCVAATLLDRRPLLGVGALALAIAGYAGMGAFIHWRRLPSIVVTLGASFVWLGLAILLMPEPGGATPDWLIGLIALKPPIVPLPAIILVLAAAVSHVLLMRTPFGVIVRGVGGNERSIARAGWSLLFVRTVMYACAGVAAVLAGLTLAGLNHTGDPNIGAQYTLLSIAAVIVGGGEFFGGIVSPIGAVIGGLIMLLTGSLLSFFDISSDWQLSVQGGLLIVVLATRALRRRA